MCALFCVYGEEMDLKKQEFCENKCQIPGEKNWMLSCAD